MYVLIGEKSTAVRLALYRPQYIERTEVHDEPVALFTTKKKAKAYAESVTLSGYHWNEAKDGLRIFYKRSLLHGFDSYRIRKQWKTDLPVNPIPRK